MKVSVIIPNYNHASFLQQRIDSVLNQTYQDFELIILDDCSTDHSREVLAAYKDHPKVSQLIFNEQNSGSPFLQWEKGISLAKGEYIWIAESDDWCEPTLLEVLLQGIEQDPACVISYCQMYCVNDKNDIKWQSWHRCLSEVVDSATFIEDYLAVKVSIYNASMAIFRKTAYAAVTKEYLAYKFSGDHLFWIQVAMQGKVHISGKLLNYFRKHDGDVSSKAYSSGLNFIEALRIINWMYDKKLISDRTYAAGFKKQFKAYWPLRKHINAQYNVIAKQLFDHPRTSRASKYNMLPSAVWNTFKKH
ncbi:glycosyltransferase family 2 protein [Pedobacter sp. SAFR-022]|uniref:glycosyltransferase family 2 protein n=1 Tax=Pedobacter sp. SAFR-022 TaxID=3436861 RepID=UPI003F803584